MHLRMVHCASKQEMLPVTNRPECTKPPEARNLEETESKCVAALCSYQGGGGAESVSEPVLFTCGFGF